MADHGTHEQTAGVSPAVAGEPRTSSAGTPTYGDAEQSNETAVESGVTGNTDPSWTAGPKAEDPRLDEPGVNYGIDTMTIDLVRSTFGVPTIQGTDLMSQLGRLAQRVGEEIKAIKSGGAAQEFSFAVPTDVWILDHNRGSFGVDVQTFDQNGDPLEGDVRHMTPDQIEVRWFYPTAGMARIY